MIGVLHISTLITKISKFFLCFIFLYFCFREMTSFIYIDRTIYSSGRGFYSRRDPELRAMNSSNSFFSQEGFRSVRVPDSVLLFLPSDFPKVISIMDLKG